MTLEELIKIARTDFLDQFTEVFVSSNDLMIRSLSEAQKQACNRTDFIFDDTKQITLVSGQASYALPSTLTSVENMFFESNEVTLTTRESISHVDPLWRSYTSMTGKPVNAVITGYNVRFSPSPDATDNGKTVDIEGYIQPGSLTALSDTPLIPDEYHRDLIFWALHEAYLKANAFDQANYYLLRFDSVFGKPVHSEQRLIRMQGSQSIFIRPYSYTTNSTIDSDDWD